MIKKQKEEKAMTKEFIDVYGIPCPYCRAPRKKPCTTSGGTKTSFHVVRHLAAKKIAAKKTTVSVEPESTPAKKKALPSIVLILLIMATILGLIGGVLYLYFVR